MELTTSPCSSVGRATASLERWGDGSIPSKDTNKGKKMLHDIKVFNPKGKLLKVINAQKLYDAKYAQISASIGKTPWGQESKKANGILVVCVICKKEVEGRTNQITCGSDKCGRERIKRRTYPNSLRKFKCPECGVKIETRHHNKKTCGQEECFTINRAKGEKIRIQKLKEKKHGKRKKING